MELRIRNVGWRVVAGGILLAALVAGCIAVPVPTPDAEQRYSSRQLDVVGREATTANSIRAELGPADLTRDNGRIWIYTWHKVSGMLIDVPLWTDDPVTPGGELVSKQYLLVLEFDADGNLQSKELIQEAPHSGRQPYCTSSGLCIAGEVPTWDVTFGLAYVFDDYSSIVTVKDQARERVTRLEPERDECLLTLWPSAEWKQLANSGRGGDEPPEALALMVEGTIHWWHWQSLPVGTYARMVVRTGEQLISVWHPKRDESSAGAAAFDESTGGRVSAATFRCGAGEQVYLAIGPTIQVDRGFPGARPHARKGFPIVLRAVEATAAQSMILNMPQFLPPE